MLVVVITGSIGMGKSTTAKMFAALGIPVADSDAIVHRLYTGDAVPLIEAAFPGTTADGAVDRARLSDAVLDDRAALHRLEAIVHPLVRAAQQDFIDEARGRHCRAALLDIPLFFETGAGASLADLIVVVSAPAEEQRRRVLSRTGMTAAKFEHILSRQMPDSEKRRRAHAVIDTGRGLDAARRQVGDLVRAFAAVPGRH